jgi:hypothetical protein
VKLARGHRSFFFFLSFFSGDVENCLLLATDGTKLRVGGEHARMAPFFFKGGMLRLILRQYRKFHQLAGDLRCIASGR